MAMPHAVQFGNSGQIALAPSHLPVGSGQGWRSTLHLPWQLDAPWIAAHTTLYKILWPVNGMGKAVCGIGEN